MGRWRGGWTVPAAAAAGWAAAAALVLAIYGAVVVGGARILGQGETSRLLLILVATVVVSVTLEPVRRGTRRWVARFLHAGLVNPYEVLAGFGRPVGAGTSVEDVSGRMARLIVEGLEVSWAQLWLTGQGDSRLIAAWPARVAAEFSETVSPSGVSSVDIRRGDRVLGALRVGEREGRPLTAVEWRLLRGVADQAGVLLETAQLQAELSERVLRLVEQERQLRDARLDLVTASHAERRRLERNLHDGAQQQLVALGINLGVVRQVVGTGDDRAVQLIVEQAEAAEDAIRTLTLLARGSAPEVLTRGLGPALQAAAAACPVPVQTRLADVGRLDPDLEAAVYFCAAEALQNAVKHARCGLIELQLQLRADHLVLRVADDGVGAFPAAPAGSGLRSMRERVAGLRGSVQITPRPGLGTTVELAVPLAATSDRR